jgi:cobalamin biosynthetic protein CobC
LTFAPSGKIWPVTHKRKCKVDNGKRDHGGGLDAAAARHGGQRRDWLDLSTGINPVPYPLPQIGMDAWTALPDEAALSELEAAARFFWQVPDDAAVMAVPGASAAIVHIPHLAPAGTVHIPESFCDVTPDQTLMDQSLVPGTLILKSFGKFWGLAGVRLGFVIGDPALVNQLRAMLGPWCVAGPALAIGADALHAERWAEETRERLHKDALRLDALVAPKGAKLLGGTDLFRLYDVENAADWQNMLAKHMIWSRVFPYNSRWLRLGLPAPDQWPRIEKAIS